MNTEFLFDNDGMLASWPFYLTASVLILWPRLVRGLRYCFTLGMVLRMMWQRRTWLIFALLAAVAAPAGAQQRDYDLCNKASFSNWIEKNKEFEGLPIQLRESLKKILTDTYWLGCLDGEIVTLKKNLQELRSIRPSESSSAVRFHCYEGGGCPPVGSEREQAAQAAAAAPKPRPWYKDWQFWTARAVSAGFSLWDGETTLRCIQQNPICYETNGLLGRRPSRGRIYTVGAVALAGETAVLAAIWRKSPEYGRNFSWGTAGVRAVLHTVHARENVKNTCPASGCAP